MLSVTLPSGKTSPDLAEKTTGFRHEEDGQVRPSGMAEGKAREHIPNPRDSLGSPCILPSSGFSCLHIYRKCRLFSRKMGLLGRLGGSGG